MISRQIVGIFSSSIPLLYAHSTIVKRRGYSASKFPTITLLGAYHGDN